MSDSQLNIAERDLQQPFSKKALGGPVLMMAIIFAAALLLQSAPDRQPLPPASVLLHAEPLSIDPAGVAPLRLAGAWRLTAPDPRFGGISALAIDQGRFLALSDSGILYRFAVPGTPDATVDISELPDGPGSPLFKVNRDSESLVRDARGRGWWVGFETRNQIWLYDRTFKNVLGKMDFGQDRWPRNLGLEAMAAEGDGLLLVPELAQEVVRVAAGKSTSKPLIDADTRVSDMTRLPSGEPIVVTRRISFDGIPGLSVGLGLLVEHGDGWRIEQRVPLALGRFANLEAITSQPLPNGATRLWLMTDDNFQLPLTTMLLALDVPPGRWLGGKPD